MDFSLYIFMFPVAILVATVAMMSGIAGTALFMPIFLLIFPLLGDVYVLTSPVAAIAVALLTSSFGFGSGFIAYYRKGLIDFRLARPFILLSVPAAILGALICSWFNPDFIRLFYGMLMLVLAGIIFKKGKRSPVLQENKKEFRPKRIATLAGGFLTGLLSVGIGEMVMPQFLKGGIALPIAAASSVFIVIVTVISASFTHIATLINEGGINAVPWNLVCYTIPGVIIGGQIGPALQGKVPTRKMEIAIAVVFVLISIGMISTFIRSM